MKTLDGSGESWSPGKGKLWWTYRGGEDVVGTAVEEEGAAHLRVRELDAAHLSYIKKTQHAPSFRITNQL